MKTKALDIIIYAISVISVISIWSVLLFLLSLYIPFNFRKTCCFGIVAILGVSILPYTYFQVAPFLKENPILAIGLVVFALFLMVTAYTLHTHGCGWGIKSVRKNRGIFPYKILLTFDDGPSSNTPYVLDILKRYSVRGVFFVVGKRAEKNVHILKRTAQEGHILGVHTYSHIPLVFLSSNQIKSEIKRCADIIREIGYEPKHFRPPWGFYNAEVIKIADELGLKTILWSRSSKDWTGISSKDVLKNATFNMEEGDIILFHDGGDNFAGKNTLEALPKVIEYIREKFK